MATKKWETMQTIYCNRIQKEVALEGMVVYPPENLPDHAPQIIGHRCSEGVVCNLLEKPTCLWAGTNPMYDPFWE
ncbi:MAG: hypothetical protein Fur0022_46480 [Anaerolineales bacterium]